MNDIDSSIDSALFHINKGGYDAVTFNPFLGNLEATVNIAHQFNPELGIFVLTLTSNVEASRYQKETRLNGKALYIAIAEDIKKFNADGCVIGATGHITKNEFKRIRTIVGDDKIILVPGMGIQKGDPIKVINVAGPNILINVGRAIIYSENPRKKAKTYNRVFNEIRCSLV